MDIYWMKFAAWNQPQAAHQAFERILYVYKTENMSIRRLLLFENSTENGQSTARGLNRPSPFQSRKVSDLRVGWNTRDPYGP